MINSAIEFNKIWVLDGYWYHALSSSLTDVEKTSILFYLEWFYAGREHKYVKVNLFAERYPIEELNVMSWVFADIKMKTV